MVKYIFTDPRGYSTGGKKSFDHIQDHRYLLPSFMQLYGVNIDKDDITWYEYKTMLEGCFLNTCTMSKVIQYRTAELPKDPRAKEQALDMKAKYRLHDEKDSGLGGLFDSLKGAAENGS